MTEHEAQLLKPMATTSTRFYAFVGVLMVMLLWGGISWWTQIRYGLQMTGLNNIVIWGLYISTFVFLIGISHAGILISATVRLMNLEKYKPVARIAEVLTVSGLAMAVLSVVVDLGRPDRILTLLLNLKLGSPLAWDLVFISLYFAFSAFYLFVSLREDVIACSERFDKRGAFYRVLTKIYNVITPKDKHRYERMLWWIALIILPFPVFGSGMVVPFIFSLLVARPAWNAPFFGPYFLTAAIVSGISTVVVIAVIIRKVYNWENVIKSDLIVGLGNTLKVGIPIYLYFTFVEQFTVQYVREHAELAVSDYILKGPYAVYFWGMIVLGFLIPELILLIPRTRTVKGVFLSSILVTVALWVKRAIIVVPTLVFPNLPYETGVYVPTLLEWSILGGIFTLGILIYTAFVKLFPIVELEIAEVI
jgi:molybdopterin-containing oxidoreductase family membrane subunit